MPIQIMAQEGGITGIIKSGYDSTALPGATVVLEKHSGSFSQVQNGKISDIEGKFSIDNVPYGKYFLKINFIGYAPYSREIHIKQNITDLNIVYLAESSLMMGEVEIVGQALFGEQMGDTTQFHASAFKTSVNANAEDLVRKLPGVTLVDGKIQAQGEQVMEILVDGKRFFEGDVEAALKNLPAEMIQNVQIFDKKSDEAEFSGFDDGEEAKTINIVTKPDRRTGHFGQMSLGYGNDKRYLAGISLNSFTYNDRITVSGLSNNINTTRYAIGETPGSGLKDDGDGSKTINKIALNYNGEWGEKVEVSGNYFYDDSRDVVSRFLHREYFTDSGQVYTEENYNVSHSIQQGVKMRLEYDINAKNELTMKPEFALSRDKGQSSFLGNTINTNGPVNYSTNKNTSKSTGMEWKNEIHYRHRFGKKGRTFSSSIEVESGSDDGNNRRTAHSEFYNGEDYQEVLDQLQNTTESDLSWQVEASFTEPVGKHSRLQLEYEINNQWEDSDKKTYNWSEQTGGYTLPDTLLSNIFNSDYLTQEVEVGYQYSTEKVKIEVETAYENADLQNRQFLPEQHKFRNVFTSVLPSVEIDYRFTDSRHLEVEYRTGTDAPALEQLQDVIDNSNPLHLSTGNPDLRQTYQNDLELKYKSFNPETSKVFTARLEGSVTQNTIANSVFIARVPVKLNEEITLQPGAQLTRPVNLKSGNWDVGSSFSYGLPLAFIQSNLSINGGVSYSKNPGIVNETINHSHAGNFRFGISISSNISEKADFTFSTRSSFSVVENTLQVQLNNHLFNQSTRFKGNFVLWKKLSFRTELKHQLNTGMSADYDNSYFLWNIGLSRFIFKHNRGEISVTVNDLLNQNSNIDRNITELYLEDRRSNVLQQFFMLSFSYSIRHFRDE